MLSEDAQKKIFDFVNDRLKILYLSDCYDEDENNNEYREDLMRTVGASDVSWGASKIVFWFDELEDYVIKIPVVGRFDSYEEDYIEYDSAYLDYLDCSNNKNDYCGLECLIYSFICNNYNDLVPCFAANYYIGTTDHGIPFYACKKMKTSIVRSKHVKISENSKNKARLAYDTYGAVGGLSEYVISLFYENYGEVIVSELLNFIFNYGIGDLHSGNIGFDQDNKVVLIDYCGFFD